MKPSERKYTGPLQFFHNYEHDPEGRTHCLGPPSNPYIIIHDKGKHKINTPMARGHDKKGDTHWFKFPKIAGGFDLARGEEVPLEWVTEALKKPAVKNPLFDKQKKDQLKKKRKKGH
ncbi:MAG: hypothetical protein KKH70_20225 [Gammaproteobacteria bacterium]|nr:hypothetical protein [Gammaproteobacteria bacterium]